jgi:hypothetical protein
VGRGKFAVGREALEETPGVGNFGFDEGAGDVEAEGGVEATLVLGEASREVGGGREAEGNGLPGGFDDDDGDFAFGEGGLSGDREGGASGDDDVFYLVKRDAPGRNGCGWGLLCGGLDFILAGWDFDFEVLADKVSTSTGRGKVEGGHEGEGCGEGQFEEGSVAAFLEAAIAASS